MEKGLLAVWVDVPSALKPEFDRWYDEEHLPERAAVPDFASAIRYDAADVLSNSNMAMYELDSLSALDHPQYLKLKASPATELGARVRSGWQNHERRVYSLSSSLANGGSRHTNTPFLLSGRSFVSQDAVGEARSWFDETNAERVLEVPGVRFHEVWEAVDGESDFLTLLGLDDPMVIQTREWGSAIHLLWPDHVAGTQVKSLHRVYRRRTTLTSHQR